MAIKAIFTRGVKKLLYELKFSKFPNLFLNSVD